MLPQPLHPEPTLRLADRLAAARRGRFVGRQAETELFRSALLAAESPFVVLHLHGPGGVGKTTLLREYARVATECGRPVVRLDGRNLDPTPPGFRLALEQALGLENGDSPPGSSDWPPAGVLLIDTYETLTSLDPWLRDTFLPQLPAQSLVVIAGRNPPAPAWRTDLDWAALTRIVPLRNLRPEESQTYLTTRGIPADQHAEVLDFTHGHPLALALVADVLNRGDKLAAFDPMSEPDVVRILLERLVHDVPSAQHRQALEVCILARVTTESLLAEVLGTPDAHDLFTWLRGLTFIEQGPQGLCPHDLAREALEADLRWRDPSGRRQLSRRLSTTLETRLQQARGVEQQRVWFDLIYLYRHNPLYERYFAWTAMDSVYAEPASPADHPAILAMVRQHQGDTSARIAEHWLRRQPEAFLVYRNLEGDVFGFAALVALHLATPEDLAADPAAVAALRFMERHGPMRPGEEAVYTRFWMGRDAYQDVSPAVNLTAINSSIYWTTHPKLAWNFIAIAEPEMYEPHFSGIHMWRSPEADFEVGGHRYGIFAHDWRVEPAAAWFNVKAELVSLTDHHPAQQEVSLSPPILVLSQSEFTDAVRQALRDYTRPDRLAKNPLMGTRIFTDTGNQEPSPATLQALLHTAVATMTVHPRDIKFHRALWHTYFEPAPTQERAAELLDLPFNTYRYHLATGIQRVADWLWQRELDTGGH